MAFKQTVTLQRTMSRRADEQDIKEQVKDLVLHTLDKKVGNCWEAGMSPVTVETTDEDQYRFQAKVHFSRKDNRGNQADQFARICDVLERACVRSKYGRSPWVIVDGALANEKGEVVPRALAKPPTQYGDINLDPAEHFRHIFGRDEHIQTVIDTIQAAARSDFKQRYNVALHGPPACGKTEILNSVGNMLGEEGDAYVKFDGTAMTQAGLHSTLADLGKVPPVMIVEEIEKTDPNILRPFLGLLDGRGELRKSTHRNHTVLRMPMLCLVTVNNIKLFNSVLSGALGSRFPLQLYCPRPDRSILTKILLREVTKGNGDPAWIEPALDFCDELEITDPRKVSAICLTGGDELLTGEFQDRYSRIMYRPEHDED